MKQLVHFNGDNGANENDSNAVQRLHAQTYFVMVEDFSMLLLLFFSLHLFFSSTFLYYYSITFCIVDDNLSLFISYFMFFSTLFHHVSFCLFFSKIRSRFVTHLLGFVHTFHFSSIAVLFFLLWVSMCVILRT